MTFPSKTAAIIATTTIFYPLSGALIGIKWQNRLVFHGSLSAFVTMFNQDCHTEVETPISITTKKIPGVKFPLKEVVLILFLHYCVMTSSPNTEQRESRKVAS